MPNPTYTEPALLLTEAQLGEIVSRLLVEKLTPLLTALGSVPKQPQAPEYLTTQQALDFIRLSAPTLNKLRRQGHITAQRSATNRLLYKRSELVAYLEAAQQLKERVAAW